MDPNEATQLTQFGYFYHCLAVLECYLISQDVFSLPPFLLFFAF